MLALHMLIRQSGAIAEVASDEHVLLARPPLVQCCADRPGLGEEAAPMQCIQ